MNDLLMTVFLDSLPFFAEPHVGILTFLLLHNFPSRYYETLCDYFSTVYFWYAAWVFMVLEDSSSELLVADGLSFFAHT